MFIRSVSAVAGVLVAAGTLAVASATAADQPVSLRVDGESQAAESVQPLNQPIALELGNRCQHLMLGGRPGSTSACWPVWWLLVNSPRSRIFRPPWALRAFHDRHWLRAVDAARNREARARA